MLLLLIPGGCLMLMKNDDCHIFYRYCCFVLHSQFRKAPSTGQSFSKNFSKYLVTFPLMTLMIVFLIVLMIFFLHLMDYTKSSFGVNSFLQYVPLVIYSFVPSIAAFLLDQVIVLLNEFENHPPVSGALYISVTSFSLFYSSLFCQEQEESALIMKQFVFQFINRYCALIYAAFYLRDLDILRTLLASLLITNAVISSTFCVLLAYICLTSFSYLKMS